MKVELNGSGVQAGELCCIPEADVELEEIAVVDAGKVERTPVVPTKDWVAELDGASSGKLGAESEEQMGIAVRVSAVTCVEPSTVLFCAKVGKLRGVEIEVLDGSAAGTVGELDGVATEASESCGKDL